MSPIHSQGSSKYMSWWDMFMSARCPSGKPIWTDTTGSPTAKCWHTHIRGAAIQVDRMNIFIHPFTSTKGTPHTLPRLGFRKFNAVRGWSIGAHSSDPTEGTPVTSFRPQNDHFLTVYSWNVSETSFFGVPSEDNFRVEVRSLCYSRLARGSQVHHRSGSHVRPQSSHNWTLTVDCVPSSPGCEGGDSSSESLVQTLLTGLV